MNVASIQQVNEIGCDECLWPTCPEPQVECQSIELDVCGYALPAHGSMPAADACGIYKTRESKEVRAQHDTDTVSGVTTVYANDETNIETRETAHDAAGDCDERYLSGSHEFTESTTITPEGDDPTTDESYTETSTAGTDEVYTGTYSYTDNLDAGNNSSGPIFVGVPVNLTPDGSWSYTGVGVYSRLNPTPGTYDSITETVTYGNRVTLATMVAEIDAIKAALAAEVEEIDQQWPGTECESAVEFTYGYESEEIVCTQISGLRISRYRFEIPDGYDRSVYELQWSEYFFSTAWDEWDARVAAHDAWLAGGSVGPEPEAPGTEPTAPTLVADRSWTWGGDPGEPYSPWYEQAIPEGTTVPGMTRRVNLAVNCWASTRYGRKPTFYGETYTPPA